MQLPNYLTWLRITLIPFLVLVYYLPTSWNHFLATSIFAIACFTDWLDGYIARSWDQTSKMGAFLDPVADKLIVSIALVIIVGEVHLPLLAIPAAVIIAREIVVSALREWMAEIGERTTVAVSTLGKYKTGVQMLAVMCLLFYNPGHSIWFGILGYLLLCIAAVLTLVSMLMYLKAAKASLTF